VVSVELELLIGAWGVGVWGCVMGKRVRGKGKRVFISL
jgi:hypothetical protein